MRTGDGRTARDVGFDWPVRWLWGAGEPRAETVRKQRFRVRTGQSVNAESGGAEGLRCRSAACVASRRRAVGESLDELSRRHAQGAGESTERLERDLVLAALDVADERSVHVGPLGQLLLGPTLLVAELANVSAECGCNFGSAGDVSHPANFVDRCVLIDSILIAFEAKERQMSDYDPFDYDPREYDERRAELARPTYYDDAVVREPPFEYLRRYLADLDETRDQVAEALERCEAEAGEVLISGGLYREANSRAGHLKPSSGHTRNGPSGHPCFVAINIDCTYCNAPSGSVCATAANRIAMNAHACRQRSSSAT